MGRLRYPKMQGDAPPQLQGTRACQAGLWAPGLSPTRLQNPLGSGCQEPRFGGSEFTHDRGLIPRDPGIPAFPAGPRGGPEVRAHHFFPILGLLPSPDMTHASGSPVSQLEEPGKVDPGVRMASVLGFSENYGQGLERNRSRIPPTLRLQPQRRLRAKPRLQQRLGVSQVWGPLPPPGSLGLRKVLRLSTRTGRPTHVWAKSRESWAPFSPPNHQAGLSGRQGPQAGGRGARKPQLEKRGKRPGMQFAALESWGVKCAGTGGAVRWGLTS